MKYFQSCFQLMQVCKVSLSHFFYKNNVSSFKLLNHLANLKHAISKFLSLSVFKKKTILLYIFSKYLWTCTITKFTWCTIFKRFCSLFKHFHILYKFSHAVIIFAKYAYEKTYSFWKSYSLFAYVSKFYLMFLTIFLGNFLMYF